MIDLRWFTEYSIYIAQLKFQSIIIPKYFVSCYANYYLTVTKSRVWIITRVNKYIINSIHVINGDSNKISFLIFKVSFLLFNLSCTVLRQNYMYTFLHFTYGILLNYVYFYLLKQLYIIIYLCHYTYWLAGCRLAAGANLTC